MSEHVDITRADVVPVMFRATGDAGPWAEQVSPSAFAQTSPIGTHPVADLFPMLGADELADLAADIKERGLLHPIVLDGGGRILDGRNRLAACEMAGVEPTFTTYDGDDPDGYALAVNVARRQLRPGQRYLVIERARRLSGYTESYIADQGKVAQPRLAEAAVVIDHAPGLADLVMSGAMSLDTAAKQARELKRREAERQAKVARLRSKAKDLAALVDDEAMDVDEALAALEAREEKQRQEAERKKAEAAARASEQQRELEAQKAEEQRQRLVATHLLCEHVVTVAQLRDGTTAERYSPSDALPGRAVTRQVIGDAIAALEQILTIWKERKLP